MVEELKLLPCPFCGSEEVSSDQSGDNDFDVTCWKCKAGVIGVGPSSESRESAIEAWNTRPSQEAPAVQQVERVAERLLASIWFYGNFRAETHNERLLEQHMRRVGLWPFASEDELLAALSHGDAAPSGMEGE